MMYEKVPDAFKDGNFKFKREEFLHPDIIKAVGYEKSLWYISLFQVNFSALLRETLNAPVILNTWSSKLPGPGYHVGRGTRPPSYRPKGGGSMSMHYLSMALDSSSPAYTPQQMFMAVLANEAKFKAIGLTTIEGLESTPGWLHGDGRAAIPGVHPDKGFLIVNPPR